MTCSDSRNRCRRLELLCEPPRLQIRLDFSIEISLVREPAVSQSTGASHASHLGGPMAYGSRVSYVKKR